jgi:hypothetical protein
MFERSAAGAGVELETHRRSSRTPAATPSPNKGQDTRAIQGWLGHRAITNDDAVAPRTGRREEPTSAAPATVPVKTIETKDF